MPSVLKHETCPACGHRHNFAPTAGHLRAGREYGFVCPESGTAATLRPTAPGEWERYAPQGAVALAEVGQPARAAA